MAEQRLASCWRVGAELVARVIYSGTSNPYQPCVWFRFSLLLDVGQ